MIRLTFLVALGVLWSVVLYNIVLALAAARYSARRGPRRRAGAPTAADWPGVSILVPAHNEQRVIERSVRNLLALDYPPDRLEIVVVDHASTDDTGAICDRLAAADSRLQVVHVPPKRQRGGKAAALNAGLLHCSQPFIAVYDADNRPRWDALRWLVGELMTTDYAGAVGRIVKLNRKNTVLNRFTAMEFAAFQWTLQAGRGQLFDLVLLPGTNFVVRADAVQEVGGWDPLALTEDLELSVRLYAAGRRIVLVPEALSEEQDPERLRFWFRQRVRWMLGNYYVMRKHAGSILRVRDRKILFHLLGLVFIYGLFLGGLVASDVIFIGGVFGRFRLDLAGPYWVLWLMAFLLFVATLLLTQALEGEDTWLTPVLAGVMYLTYTQLWLLVAVRSFSLFVTRSGRLAWETTPRFHD